MAIPLGQVVMPGDKFHGIPESDDLKLGTGMVLVKGYPTATKIGVLKHKAPFTYWIESPSSQYRAKKGDHVIGVIKRRLRDIFLVDIRETSLAILPFMEFDGATKKNRPDLKRGDVVYAKVTRCGFQTQSELTCQSPNFAKSGLFGNVMSEGVMYRGHINYIMRLLSVKSIILKTMGELMAFETAIGVNGRIVINGKTTSQTLTLVDLLIAGEYMTDNDFQKFAIHRTKSITNT